MSMFKQRWKPVPKYKKISGHKYELSSQDISKSSAKQKAKEMRSWGYKAQALPMKGSYRVYKYPKFVEPKK